MLRRALDHPFYSGNSRCIDAFTVALNQACPEGEKRWSLSTLERQPLSFSSKKLPKRGEEKLWYTSTLELQVVSLELCRACRRVPTVHVRVNDFTPRTLRPPSKPRRGEPGTCSSKVRRTSRVPAVRPLRVTLADLEEFGMMKSAEKWAGPIENMSFDDTFDKGIGGVVWPTSVRTLSLGEGFNQLVNSVVWPASLLVLSFGGMFNQPVNGVVWPVSLRALFFGEEFAQPIAGVVRPASLQQWSSEMISTILSWGSFGQPPYRRYNLALPLTSPSPESFGRRPCRRCHLALSSTSPSPELRGPTPFNSCHLDLAAYLVASISPSLESRGPTPCRSFLRRVCKCVRSARYRDCVAADPAEPMSWLPLQPIHHRGRVAGLPARGYCGKPACGRRSCRKYGSGVSLTSPSSESYGQLPCGISRSGGSLTSTSSELCGQHPCGS